MIAHYKKHKTKVEPKYTAQDLLDALETYKKCWNGYIERMSIYDNKKKSYLDNKTGTRK